MPQIQIFLPDDTQVAHDLTEEKITVGRLADNSLQIDDGSVSSHHAELIAEDGKYRLVDLGSTNGTFVNDEQVTDVILQPGDSVRFGRIPALFTAAEEAGNSQPLPENASMSVAEVASQSARPAGFVSSSPVPRKHKTKDLGAVLLYAATAIAVIAFGVAVYFVSALQATA